MTEPTVAHATFVIERHYPAPPPRVFAAWATAEAKLQWFSCDDTWTTVAYQLDFRVGGTEVNDVAPPGGPLHRYEAKYLDIVPDRRIIYAYDMRLGERRISVSLATVLLQPTAAGTRFEFTEQVVFLDGYMGRDERQHGTEIGLDKLGAILQAEAAAGPIA